MKQLVSRYLDGTASEAQVAELSSLLRSDAAAREEYLRIAAVHARLATDASVWMKQQAHPLQPRSRVWNTALAAASILLPVLLWIFSTRDTASPVPVATLLRTEHAVWAGDSPLEGGRLHVGRLRLRAGSAMLRLDGGAQLRLQGAVDLRLDDCGSVTLLAGEIRAEVPEEAVGFTVQTPGGKLVDLGTEFITSVNRDGQTEVSVVKGAVEVPDSAGVVHRLTTGDALALNRAGTVHRLPPRLAASVSQPLVQNARDGLPTGQLLVHETFHYPEGDQNPAVLTGGTGWSGPWKIFEGYHSGQPWSDKMHQMEMRTFDGRAAWVSAVGKSRCQRLLAQPISLKTNAVHYVSLRWFEEELLPEQRAMDFWPTPNVLLDLRGPEETGPGRVGLRVNCLLHPKIESGMGQGFDGRAIVREGRRLLMVGKILSRREGEDEVYLRVFDAEEPPDPVEPGSWDVVTRGLRLDAVLDRVVLYSIGPKPRRIEEIRIGTTWHDVVAGWDAGTKHQR